MIVSFCSQICGFLLLGAWHNFRTMLCFLEMNNYDCSFLYVSFTEKFHYNRRQLKDTLPITMLGKHLLKKIAHFRRAVK